ncbi:MAG: hypothetical protein WC782_00750 [Methylococcaceae bacterium]|jgi:hypothetical protein
MKKISTLLIIFSCLTLVACGKGEQVNGHNMRTAYKSVKALKNRLPPDSRVEFEVSFWTIRDSLKTDEAFLDAVDGKKPQEIIALGKEIYQQRKNSGFPAYEQFSSWDQMIAKFGQERLDQEKGTRKTDPKDKANDILYKL